MEYGELLWSMKFEKNYAIEWYRYFFSFFICTLHFKEYFGNPYPFGGSYLAVEFFLILSGFLLMRTIDRTLPDVENVEQSTWKFALERFWRLWPQYIISWLILAAYCVFFRHSVTIKNLVIDYPADAFMLQMLGIGPRLNSAMWYVSALFLVSITIFYLACKNRRRFVYIIAPICVALLYSYFYQTKGMLAGIGWTNSLIVRDGFWRGLAGICLGCIVYELSTKIPLKYRSYMPVVRRFYEVGTLSLLSVMYYQAGCTVKDFTLVFMMGLLILSVMCGSKNEGSYLTRLLSRIPLRQSYAYAIYCNHWVINYIIQDYFPDRPFYPMLCVYVLLTVIMSVITTKFIGQIQKFLKNGK